MNGLGKCDGADFRLLVGTIFSILCIAKEAGADGTLPAEEIAREMAALLHMLVPGWDRERKP